MRKTLAGMAVCVALCGAPAVAFAQVPPTTVENSTVEREVTVTSVETSTVKRQVPVTTVSELVKADGDDDSDNTGLWGLLGLLGLLGLAGLAGLRRRHDDDASGGYSSRGVSADTTPRGSSPKP